MRLSLLLLALVFGYAGGATTAASAHLHPCFGTLVGLVFTTACKTDLNNYLFTFNYAKINTTLISCMKTFAQAKKTIVNTWIKANIPPPAAVTKLLGKCSQDVKNRIGNDIKIGNSSDIYSVMVPMVIAPNAFTSAEQTSIATYFSNQMKACTSAAKGRK